MRRANDIMLEYKKKMVMMAQIDDTVGSRRMEHYRISRHYEKAHTVQYALIDQTM